ncbi:MAG: substrate-binding domain-containing protein, partial [Lentisphaerae bacterium]|nr:substrate-binding domain-containing protein [Lentisphaerota bacterium]
MGLRIPQDVSLISFGDKQRRSAIANQITSVVVDYSDVGCRAFQLINEINNRQRSIYDQQKIHIPLHFNDGNTLAASNYSIG